MGARALGFPRKTARRMREPAPPSSGRRADDVDDRGSETALLAPLKLLPVMPVPLPTLALALEAYITRKITGRRVGGGS